MIDPDVARLGADRELAEYVEATEAYFFTL